MAKSVSRKPAKPYPDFPLTAHANGQWCKKIAGKVRFFGVWADPIGAKERYLRERDDLHAGRTPSRLSSEGRPTTERMIVEFLDRTLSRAESGEISRRSYVDYVGIGKAMIEHFGSTTDPTKLRPTDFAAFRSKLSKTYGLFRVRKSVTVCRMFFKWAFESELIDSMPRFGPDFSTPTAKQRRIHKATTGKKLLTAAEAKALVSMPDPMWRAICLLGLNGGLGNTDAAELRLEEIAGEWLSKPRGKTGVDRRIPLWPETVEALAEWAKLRPAPRPGCESLVFLSGHGRKLIRVNESGRTTDLTAAGFRRARKSAGVDRKGIGFYWLRHTFQTIGDGARDAVATSAIMGHVDSSMAGSYREGIDDERLLAVVEHVRQWVKA
jgi:integrase